MTEGKADLKVIGAGYGRTGTASLKRALEQLGFGPCHHMEEVGKNFQFKLWCAVQEGRPDWNAIFGQFLAAVDFPSASYYEETMAEFPQGKVILSVRDNGEAWYKSARETILSDEIIYPPLELRVLFACTPLGYARRMVAAMYSKVGLTPEVVLDKAKAVANYDAWIVDVKKKVPADRLLVFNVKEGWDPLCKFLGVPVPSGPFPRVNEADDFKKNKAKAIRIAKILVRSLLALCITGAGSLAWYFRQRRSLRSLK